MSGQLFAFNVSKKTESVDEKKGDQWVGNQTAQAYCYPCYCTGASYGVFCYVDPLDICYTSGGSSYYICDSDF